jgi:hypothetical protein
MTTELNSLANGSGAAGSGSWDNSTGLWPFAYALMSVTFGSNPTLNNTCDLYLIPSFDGTNFADYVTGATPFVPPGFLLGVFVVRATTSLQRIPLSLVGPLSQAPQLPGLKLRPYLINRSGVALPSSGSTITIHPQSWKSV